MLASEFAHHHTGLPVGQACRGTLREGIFHKCCYRWASPIASAVVC